MSTLDDLATLPPLDTARLTLSRLGPEDADALVAVTDAPEILSVIPFLPRPFDRAAAQALLADIGASDSFLGIRDRADGGLLGVVGLHLRTPPWLEIGYWLAPAYHGRGLGAEAAQTALAAARQHFPHRRPFAVCRADNLASQRILVRLGLVSRGPDSDGPGRLRFESR